MKKYIYFLSTVEPSFFRTRLSHYHGKLEV